MKYGSFHILRKIVQIPALFHVYKIANKNHKIGHFSKYIWIYTRNTILISTVNSTFLILNISKRENPRQRFFWLKIVIQKSFFVASLFSSSFTNVYPPRIAMTSWDTDTDRRLRQFTEVANRWASWGKIDWSSGGYARVPRARMHIRNMGSERLG